MTLSWNDVEKHIHEKKFDSLAKFKLNVDAYRIFLRYQYDPISVVSIGKIDPLPHQIDAFTRIMSQLKPRKGIDDRIGILLADDVGLGKTIMIGLTIKELLLKNKIHRILIISPSGLQVQWQEEMNDKFNEKFSIVTTKDRDNLYLATDKAIISMDLGRNDSKFEQLLESTWDLVVIDEAHKLKPGTIRYSLAEKMGKRTYHMILASATPHDGKIENFISLLKVIYNEIDGPVSTLELNKFIDSVLIRRLKEQIVDFKGNKIFPDREVPNTINVNYTQEEKLFYDSVKEYVTTYYEKAEDSYKNTAVLALYILHRRVSSSISAGLESLKKRRNRLLEPYLDFDTEREKNYLEDFENYTESEKEEAEEVLLGATASIGEDLKKELKALDELIELGEELVNRKIDSKFESLMDLLKTIKEERPEDKLIIFSEFTDTIHFLQDNLVKAGFSVTKFTGELSPEEKKEQIANFEKSAQILLGSEAAGEGLNFQFANIEINYELPWNPNRLEQRIGRVYRYGQKKKVFIYNFKTAFPIDNAVLEKILEKIEQIRMIFGNNAVDVIGSLISEKDALEFFKFALKNSTAVENIERTFVDRIKILEQIDKFLIKERFDLVGTGLLSVDISRSINNFDIERFFLTYVQNNNSTEYYPADENSYNFIIPKIKPKSSYCVHTDPKQYTNLQFKGTFNKQGVGKYIAMGDPALESMILDSVGQECVSLIPSEEKGIISEFVLKFFDGLDREVHSESILVKSIEEGITVIDPLTVWDLEDLGADGQITGIEAGKLQELFKNLTNLSVSDIKSRIENIWNFVSEKNTREISIESKFSFSEYDLKIKNERMKKVTHLSKGQNYLLPGIEKKISELYDGYQKLVSDYEKAKNIRAEICGPVSIAILMPPNLINTKKGTGGRNTVSEEFKRKIDRAGMDYVMNHERENNRVPEDVSNEFSRGYDVESSSDEGLRYIEVKSSVEENQIEITSNEWRTASQLRDEYYLYIVSYALSDPKLKIIKDPFEKLQKYVKKKVFEDYRMILGDVPKDIVEEE